MSFNFHVGTSFEVVSSPCRTAELCPIRCCTDVRLAPPGCPDGSTKGPNVGLSRNIRSKPTRTEFEFEFEFEFELAVDGDRVSWHVVVEAGHTVVDRLILHSDIPNQTFLFPFFFNHCKAIHLSLVPSRAVRTLCIQFMYVYLIFPLQPPVACSLLRVEPKLPSRC